jgi:hypothetical protein
LLHSFLDSKHFKLGHSGDAPALTLCQLFPYDEPVVASLTKEFSRSSNPIRSEDSVMWKNVWRALSLALAVCLLTLSLSVDASAGQRRRRNPQAGKGKAAKRIGIGAGVGAGAGALIGGRKGALIGAGAGAGAGTAYHYHKKRQWRRRHRRY